MNSYQRQNATERIKRGERARTLYERGLSVRAISEQFGEGYSVGKVHAMLIEAGTMMRPRGTVPGTAQSAPAKRKNVKRGRKGGTRTPRDTQGR